LLGNTEAEVSTYLNYLNGLKPNPFFNIEKSFSPFGDLKLKCNFPLIDDSFFNCTEIVCIFHRLNGIDYCYTEDVIMPKEYAQSNINFVKDNFNFVSYIDGGSMWQKSTNPLIQKITATFISDVPVEQCGIVYELVDKKDY
jgi:hypothetical protein